MTDPSQTLIALCFLTAQPLPDVWCWTLTVGELWVWAAGGAWLALLAGALLALLFDR